MRHREGEPFVGPAGRLLDRALEEAGIDRTEVYVTNAVKHFKFKPAARGKRRIHQKPSRTEVVACRPWLLAELDARCGPTWCCSSAPARRSRCSAPRFRVTKRRGEVLTLPDRSERAMATVHPSAVLRADDREAAYAELVADLKSAASVLRG